MSKHKRPIRISQKSYEQAVEALQSERVAETQPFHERSTLDDLRRELGRELKALQPWEKVEA